MPNRNEQIEREQQSEPSSSNKTAKTKTSRAAGFSARRIALVIALVLLVIAGVTIGASLILKNSAATTNLPRVSVSNVPAGALAANAVGTVSFIDQPGGTGHSDAAKLAVDGLLTPPSGSWYAAWLVDTANNRALALGALSGQAQNYALNYTGNNMNLLGLGNEIEITLEHSSVNAPSGTVLLTAIFPPHAFTYLRHLLVS